MTSWSRSSAHRESGRRLDGAQARGSGDEALHAVVVELAGDGGAFLILRVEEAAAKVFAGAEDSGAAGEWWS